MAQEIQEYRPMHEIVLFSGASHFIESQKYEAFKAALLKEKFVEIDGELVNVSAIERVKRAKRETSVVETMLSGYPEGIKEKVRKVVKEREREGLAITEGIISNVIEKYA